MRQPWANTRAALCATLVMLIAMSVGRFTLGTPLVPEFISQQIFALITPRLFTAAIRLLGFGAKWIVFGFATVGYIGGGVGLGWVYAGWLRGDRR